MRLLNIRDIDLDIVKLETFHKATARPPYVILSHTWSNNPCNEVSFHDVHDGNLSYRQKRAWNKKVKGFCLRSRQAGYNFVWVDTCCIDQANSTELQEAINSMYVWYQSSAACLVHLHDVLQGRGRGIFENARTKARKPRWFTRGWTLQELIAPQRLFFYDRHWNRLGSRGELAAAVRRLTGIPLDVLQGRNPCEYSIPVRWSWARGRSTKKPEDRAWSMLGLFQVDVPIAYGLGKEKALLRLLKAVKERQENPALSFGSDATQDMARALEQLDIQGSRRNALAEPMKDGNKLGEDGDTAAWMSDLDSSTSEEDSDVDDLELYVSLGLSEILRLVATGAGLGPG